MKECTNDYFEDDIPEDDLTDAIEWENAAILEIELEMENEPKYQGYQKLQRGKS